MLSLSLLIIAHIQMCMVTENLRLDWNKSETSIHLTTLNTGHDIVGDYHLYEHAHQIT